MIRWLLIPILLLVALASQAETPPAQDQVSTDSVPTLKILSWNIYMLPRFALITGKRKRAKVIPEVLNELDYDILVLQEAFHIGTRRVMRRKFRKAYPYQYGPANHKWTPVITNSGIWIWSKIPLRPLEEIDYSLCQRDDCFARKGAFLLAGNWYGQEFQVLGTHMEAGPYRIKDTQYWEVRHLIDRHQQPGVPQILCGDYNTKRRDTAQYEEMLYVLDVENGPILSDLKTTSGGGAYIDYIFIRDNGLEIDSVGRYIHDYTHPWGRKGKDWLSDHKSVEIQIDF